MAKLPNHCPAQCSGAHREPVDVSARLLAEAGIADEWTKRARRCTYCGAIHSIESDGRKHLRGHFGGNELMLAENWVPHRGN